MIPSVLYKAVTIALAIAIVVFFGTAIIGFGLFVIFSAFITWAIGFPIPVKVTTDGVVEHRKYRWFTRIK